MSETEFKKFSADEGRVIRDVSQHAYEQCVGKIEQAMALADIYNPAAGGSVRVSVVRSLVVDLAGALVRAGGPIRDAARKLAVDAGIEVDENATPHEQMAAMVTHPNYPTIEPALHLYEEKSMVFTALILAYADADKAQEAYGDIYNERYETKLQFGGLRKLTEDAPAAEVQASA